MGRQASLDKWLHTLAGAKDNKIHELFGRRWLISCIARALEPGCVADGAIVLEGTQGIGKNRLVTSIFGDAPWVQSIGAYKVGHDIEADRIAGSAWVVHDDEMSVSRSKMTRSRRGFHDARTPTGRRTGATSSRAHGVRSSSVRPTESSTLKMSEPALLARLVRSLMPIRSACGPVLATAPCRGTRGYRAGEEWTIAPTDPMWATIEEIQRDRKFRDPIEDDVRARLLARAGTGVGTGVGPELVTISDLADWLSIPPEKKDKALEGKLGNILRELRYVRCRKRLKNGDRGYVYRLFGNPDEEIEDGTEGAAHRPYRSRDVGSDLEITRCPYFPTVSDLFPRISRGRPTRTCARSPTRAPTRARTARELPI